MMFLHMHRLGVKFCRHLFSKVFMAYYKRMFVQDFTFLFKDAKLYSIKQFRSHRCIVELFVDSEKIILSFILMNLRTIYCQLTINK